MEPDQFTPFPEVNFLLKILKNRIKEILGENLVGIYLDGSLALGGYDSASDIDFVAVIERDLSPDEFNALKIMHSEINQQNTPLAQEIEGFYVSSEAVRRYNPRHSHFVNLERGSNEQLKWCEQDYYWIIHRYILCEYGVTLTGPQPVNLIDPVSADGLRRTMSSVLDEWGRYICQKPDIIAQPGYQSYAVLTICRILYTLNAGDIVSKREAAEWASSALENRWDPLVTKALLDRQSPTTPSQAEVEETLAFLDYAVKYENRFWGRKFCNG